MLRGNAIPPVIQNGRGEAISLGNLYIIATGNSKLNEADKDYEANFKQDLSLQDRFGGSTYQIFIDYSFELNGVMRNISWRGTKKIINLTFIFNFLAMLRNAINELGFEGRAFVSTRTMVSFRDTYMVFRQNTSSKNPIPRVKTLADSIASFLSLFTEQQQAELRSRVNVTEFLSLLEEKNQLPLDELDSDADEELANQLIEDYNNKHKGEL